MRSRDAGLRRNPEFLKLWAGESVSLLGSQVTALALPLVAAVALRATPVEMGVLAAADTAPILALGLVAGAWSDRRRRRPLLLAANAGRAALLATIPLAALLGRLALPQLYAVAFLVGALGVVFDTTYQAYLPALVARDALVAGNARLEVSRSVAQVVGPAAAGALVALVTAPLAIALDAGSFVVAAVSVALIRRPEPAPAAGEKRLGLGREIVAGLRYIAMHRLLRALTAATGLANLASGAIFALLILYLARDLALPPAVIGALLTVGGPAALLGALSVDRIAGRLDVGRTLVVGSLVFTAGDFALALAGGPRGATVAVLALAQALIGFGSPVYNVTAISLRQSLTPDALLGRVTASARVVTVGALPLGALLGGALGARLGLRPTLLVAACWALLLPAWLALSPVGSRKSGVGREVSVDS